MSLTVYNIMMALLMFLRELCAIPIARAGGSSKLSLRAISLSMSATNFSDGAGTRTFRQRDRKGAITLERFSALAIMRQVGMYVSIVLRRLAWAFNESLSISWITTTLNTFCCLESSYALLATSLISF